MIGCSAKLSVNSIMCDIPDHWTISPFQTNCPTLRVQYITFIFAFRREQIGRQEFQ